MVAGMACCWRHCAEPCAGGWQLSMCWHPRSSWRFWREEPASCAAIGVASILAKVSRDRYMMESMLKIADNSYANTRVTRPSPL